MNKLTKEKDVAKTGLGDRTLFLLTYGELRKMKVKLTSQKTLGAKLGKIKVILLICGPRIGN